MQTTFRQRTHHAELIISILKNKSSIITADLLLKELNSKLDESEQINLFQQRRIINWIRISEMAPILSNSSGYWYSTNKVEIMSVAISLEERAKAIEAAARGLRQFLNEPEGLKSRITDDLFRVPCEEALETRISN